VPALSPAEMESFLLKGRIVRKRNAGQGVTNSLRVTMSEGALTHDVHVQTVDIARTSFEAGKATELNFRDSYRFNIAAYRLATLLGIRVPMSVSRDYEGKPASFTWWVDEVAMDEAGRVRTESRGPDPDRTSKQLYVMRLFDELIENRDRNRGNMLWTKDWTLWLIDHSRAFRLGNELRGCARWTPFGCRRRWPVRRPGRRSMRCWRAGRRWCRTSISASRPAVKRRCSSTWSVERGYRDDAAGEFKAGVSIRSRRSR
jgi:hypothetical protein